MKICNKTAFLVGSGPSLNKLDLSKLKGHTSLCMNRSYIAYDDWGFVPTFYFACDSRLILTIIDDIEDLLRTRPGIERFFIVTPVNRKLDKRFVNLRNEFGDRFTALQWSGINAFPSTSEVGCELHGEKVCFNGNGGACALHVLHLLGYEKIILLGIDAKYTPREESLKSGKDLSHFRADYFDVNSFVQGKNQGHDNEESHLALWKIAAEGEKKMENFKIYSSTPNSPINDLFEYVEFEKWFKDE